MKPCTFCGSDNDNKGTCRACGMTVIEQSKEDDRRGGAVKRERLRNLADQLKATDATRGNLEGVLAAVILDLLDEIELFKAAMRDAEREDAEGPIL